MAGVIVNAEVLRNQICYALARPERRLVAEFLGTGEQSAGQHFRLPAVEPRLASGAARLRESPLAAFAEFLAPAAHGLDP